MVNIQVQQEFFDKVKKQFLKLDTNIVDPEIKEVLDLFKTSSVLDCIVPRWSCQGHGTHAGKSDYEIIFCTIGDGFKVLYDLFNEIYIEYTTKGVGLNDTANPTMSFVRLLMDKFDPQEHVVLGISTYGIPERVQHSKQSFINVIKKYQK